MPTDRPAPRIVIMRRCSPTSTIFIVFIVFIMILASLATIGAVRANRAGRVRALLWRELLIEWGAAAGLPARSDFSDLLSMKAWAPARPEPTP